MRAARFPVRPTALVALSAFLPALAADEVVDERQREVVCAETAFSRAAEARDLAAFLSHLDADARFVNQEVARGRAEVAAAWAPFFDADGPRLRWRPAVVEVSSDGRLALSRGPWRSTRTDAGGARIETWGHFISTWRRNGGDGRWLVLFDSGGDAGMTPSDEERAILLGEPDCP